MKTTTLPARSLPRWLVLLLLCMGAAIALANLASATRIAVYGTARYAASIDFQWSPTHLLLHHLDPWRQQLIGNPGGTLILGQQPNYLHFIYLFFAPFGALSFFHARLLWLLANLAFTLAGILLVSRYYALSRVQTATAAILLCASAPLGVALSNGQQTLLVFLFFALALCRPNPPSPLWTGLAYFKYSFAPPLFFLVLIRRGLRATSLTLVPFVVGFLLVRAWLPTPTLTLLLEPLKVSTTVVGPGFEDLMTVLLALHAPAALAYGLPVLACGLVTWLIARPSAGYPDRAIVAAIALLGALFFKHLGYDNVLMFFPLAYALRHPRTRAAAAVFLATAWFWYGARLIHRLLPTFSDHLLAVNFLLAIALLLATLNLEPRTQPNLYRRPHRNG